MKVRGLPLNCEVCNHPVQAGTELMKHMIKEHKVKTHDNEDCDYCELKFQTTEELLAHAELDHTLRNIKVKSEQTYICKSCLQVFNNKSEQKIHKMKVHFKCKHCNFVTISTKLIEEHLLNNHTVRNLTNFANRHPEPEAQN